MKTYTRPSIIEFGDALTTIQGCGGVGIEGWKLDDSDRKYRLVSTSTGKHCICTTMNGSKCEGSPQ
ncbi:MULTISPECIES: hypothetical protein [Priestia]|uniref:hypothetical protein n=1 Tax=Priestia TaxID=2800373 RepID=UPI0011B35876|nr:MULTISPECIES: hypothetical protein [Priestia]MCG0050201.1 hypothetical protein [Priestia aryabhattai]QDZ84652.1 hypothetical protein D0441_09470 [Priestia megaterium]